MQSVARSTTAMNVIDYLEKEQMKTSVADFRPGDLVRVHLRILEGDKERVQVFEGNVVGRSGGGVRETFTVRKVSYGIGVERIFLLHSPRVERIEVRRKGKVRRAKLYYLRQRSGKKARIKERGR